MAREISIVVHCDVCQTTLTPPPAGTDEPVRLDLGKGRREIDLCAPCMADTWKPLLDLYERATGPAPAPPTRKRGYNGRKSAPMGPMECTEEGCEKWIENRDAMRTHLRAAHHTSIGAVQARLGRGLNNDPISHRCEECGDAFTTGQDWGQHRRFAHDLGPVTRAPEDARVDA